MILDVTGGKPEPDYFGISLLAGALERDDGALRKLFERSWKLPSDDERRRALVACLHAAARSANPESFVDDAVRRLGEPGIGPYFRSEIAGGVLTALADAPPAIAGPRLQATAAIFTKMFPNTSGDVSFAIEAVARIAERLVDFSPGDAKALAEVLLAHMDREENKQWTTRGYRWVAQVILGGVFVRAGERERGDALIESGLASDASADAWVLPEVLYQTALDADAWRRRLLDSIATIEAPRLELKAALVRALVDAHLDPPKSRASVKV